MTDARATDTVLGKFKFDDPAEAYRQARRRIVNNARRRQQKSLDLSDYGLVDLPPEIGLLSKLETLDLQRNRLTRLPAEIAGLKNLKRLYISKNAIGVLPTEFWGLSALKSLHADNNQLSELPRDVQNLVALERLHLASNELTELPPEVGRLTRLKSLDLNGNRIRQLPAALEGMFALEELHLDENEISSLPDELCNIPNLENLSLNGNLITALPSNIGNLKKLDWLDIDNNNISVLPDSIGRCQSLTYVFANNAGIKFLPTQIGQLKNLHSLSLSGNGLREIPIEIGLLKNLNRLDLDSNSISGLPIEIGELDSLSILSISNNRLETIPVEVGSLRSLQRMSVTNNKLQSLPASISKLKRLVCLDAANNALTDIPIEFGALGAMETAVKGPKRNSGLASANSRLNAVGLFLTGNALADPIAHLANQEQPSATLDVLAWLRGELDVTTVSDRSNRGVNEVQKPAVPSLEAGPNFRIADGHFDLVSVVESGEYDTIVQDLLLRRLQKQIALLRAENIKVGNQHPLLVRTTNEYAELLASSASEIDVVSLWAIGNSILAQALAFERQDAHKTISEPLEPLHLALLVDVARLHGGLVLGFPEGLALTNRADMARVGPDAARAIERPTSDILVSLAKQRRLVSERVRGLADALEAALISASWESARVGHTAYVTLRNFLIEAGKTIAIANDKSSTFAGGLMFSFAVQQAGLSAEATVQLFEFMRTNTSELLSFAAPFPELQAWVSWIIAHFDEMEGEKRKNVHRS